MSTRYRIQIDVPNAPPRFEIVTCVRDRLTLTLAHGLMEFERDGEVEGVPRFSPRKPRPALTEYIDAAYEIPRPGLSDEERFASVGYGVGLTTRRWAREYTLEDEEHEARVAKAKHARSCVKRPFGRPPG